MASEERDYMILIVSHGRADNVKTLECFKKCGYTGDWRIVIDDEDPQGTEYKRRYGDKVIEFKKSDYDWVDTCDLIPNRGGVVYARNAVNDIAKQLDISYYAVFDDDYIDFRFIVEHAAYLRHAPCEYLDDVFDAIFDFLDESGMDCVACAQNGDFIGGLNSGNLGVPPRRKLMNTFFCRTDSRLYFQGRANEDVTLYTLDGTRGMLFITLFSVAVCPSMTQKLDGGMSDIYRDWGTYPKSFYTIMQVPSAVKISVVGDKHPRIHHSAKQDNYAPCILSERWKCK